MKRESRRAPETNPLKKNYSVLSNTVYLINGIMKHNKFLLFLILLGSVTITAMWFQWNFVGKFVIDCIVANAKTGSHNIAPLIRVTIISAVLIFIFVAGNIFMENKMFYNIMYVRMKLIEEHIYKSLKMDYETLENPEILDCMKKAEQATEGRDKGIQGMIYLIQRCFQRIITMLTAVAIISFFNPWLLLIAAVLAIFQSIYYQHTVKIEKKLTWDNMGPVLRKQNYLNNITRDFAYAKDIRLFSMIGLLMKKQQAANGEKFRLTKLSKNQWNMNAAFSGIVTLALSIVLYGYMIKSVLYDGLSIANFTFYIYSAIGFSSNLTGMLNSFSGLKNCSEQVNDFRTFMEIPSYGEDRKTIPLTDMDSYEFIFENVSFRYPKSEAYALKNLNITLKAGQRLAVVGLNGAGKTTFIKLLLRIYDVSEGRILLNGVDVRDYDKQEYYTLFSPVFQNVEIFAFPMSENISMKKPDQTDRARAEECLRLAGMGNKLDRLTKGVDTQLLKILYDDGIDLSGGEKQKLALARALYKNAPVVVLDEPTAALDALAEYKLYMDFDKLIGNKTSVYISHRLSSTRFCDNIAMFKDGSMVEYGTHESLLTANGAYARMFEVQAQYYKDDSEVVEDCEVYADAL